MVSKQQLFNQTKKVVKKAAANSQRRPFNPNSVGSKIGAQIGARYGQAGLGMKAGDFINRVIGKGDYTVVGNSLMRGNLTKSSQIPFFTPDGKRGLRVTEREYLGDIRSGALVGGSTIFSNNSFAINPGLAATFPWLSALANNFDQWQPNGIIFEFRSTSSTFNGTSQALGTVIAATEYDVVDPQFATKVEMENSDYAMSCAASESLIHAVECSPKERQRQLYSIRNGSVPSNDIQRNYDLGNFQIATQGMSVADVNLGELWVSYDITFYKKQLFSSQGNQILWATLDSINSPAAVSNTAWYGGNSFQGNLVRQYGQGTNSIVIDLNKQIVGTTFNLFIRAFSTSGTPVIPTISFSNAVAEVTQATYTPTVSAPHSVAMYSFRITSDQQPTIIVSSTSFYATGPLNAFLEIMQTNPHMD
jgi:hypothetical protein